MITKATPNAATASVQERITRRAFAQAMAMIHMANNRKKDVGDPKVGGHPAACASCFHVLAGLHLVVREVDDYIACKPHASFVVSVSFVWSGMSARATDTPARAILAFVRRVNSGAHRAYPWEPVRHTPPAKTVTSTTGRSDVAIFHITVWAARLIPD